MFVSQHGSSENIHPSVIRRLEKVKRRLFTDDDPNYQRLTTKRICYGNINRFVQCKKLKLEDREVKKKYFLAFNFSFINHTQTEQAALQSEPNEQNYELYYCKPIDSQPVTQSMEKQSFYLSTNWQLNPQNVYLINYMSDQSPIVKSYTSVKEDILPPNLNDGYESGGENDKEVASIMERQETRYFVSIRNIKMNPTISEVDRMVQDLLNCEVTSNNET